MNITVDTTKRAARMLQGGRVTVTFRSPSGTHITILAKCRAKKDGTWGRSNLDEAQIIFFEVPNDQGWNDKVGKLTSRGFQADPNADPARAWCAQRLLDFVAGKALPAGLEAMEESACGCCGRTLTDPVSIERGIGPECFGKLTGSNHETKRGRRAGIGAGRKVAPRGDGIAQMTSLPGESFREIFGQEATA